MAKLLTAELGTLTVKAHIYKTNQQPKNISLFCLPGGGLTREYFNLASEFSFKEHMLAMGYDLIIMDNIGIGDNALPSNFPFHTPRQFAKYIAQALDIWEQDGAISGPIIGTGHSMGGMMIMLIQGGYAPFSGLALFGSNAGGLDWGLSEAEKAYIHKEADFERDIETLSLAKFKTPFTQSTGGPRGSSIVFGGQTAALTQSLRDISCGMHSASAMMSMMRGSFQTEVEAIKVSILFALGDHDIGIAPEDAPKAFINAPSTELIVLDKTGHNHFAFTSIKTLCNRLDYWASSAVCVSRNL